MNNWKGILKNSIPYVVSIIVLMVLNAVMFSPQLAGKSKPSGDINLYIAKTHELKEFKEQTGETSHWNPSIFSGMPENLLVLGFEKNVLKKFQKTFRMFVDRPIGLFFQIGFICFIALCLLGINPWLSLIGALVMSSSTNLMILFDAGHMTKVNVISFFPLIISGMLLCFKGKYLKGAAALAVGVSFAILYNHIQMVYYLIFALSVFGIVYLIYNIKDKTIAPFAKGTAVAIAAAALAGLSNFSQLSASMSFSESTMRGKSIMEKQQEGQNAMSSEVEGLEWDYAMTWSNGMKDIMGVIIPRFVGGGSGEKVSSDSEAGKLMQRIGARKSKTGHVVVPGYWGQMPFTGGPSYIGISLLFLFILSMFVIDPKIRWSILGAILVFILLSMGKHAEWFNRPLFDHFPLFNKFRAPNSTLMILPIFFVLPAILGLDKIVKAEDKSQFLKPLYYAFGLTGGFALFTLIMGGSMFDFMKPSDLQYDDQVQSILRDARASMQSSDAMRALIYVVLTGGLLWTYLSGKLKAGAYVLAGVALLMVIDLFQVNKRYVSNDDFINERKFDNQFAPDQNDQLIFSQEPKGKGFYRVFDLSINTFNDASSAYHHHQIGGHDAAKLQRYQDVIEKYISAGNMEVLNMLNAKYIITQENKVSPNPRANGTAWFVNNVIAANSAREEFDALATLSTNSSAVVLTSEFADQSISAGNGEGSIELVAYQPNKLTYKSSSTSNQVAIFSEIWYGPNKGWDVTIDGQETDHFRANYILRGMNVPAGEHEIIFEFKPKADGAWITMIASILILLLVIYAAFGDKIPLRPKAEAA